MLQSLHLLKSPIWSSWSGPVSYLIWSSAFPSQQWVFESQRSPLKNLPKIIFLYLLRYILLIYSVNHFVLGWPCSFKFFCYSLFCALSCFVVYLEWNFSFSQTAFTAMILIVLESRFPIPICLKMLSSFSVFPDFAIKWYFVDCNHA